MTFALVAENFLACSCSMFLAPHHRKHLFDTVHRVAQSDHDCFALLAHYKDFTLPVFICIFN